MDLDELTSARLQLLYPDVKVRIIRTINDVWQKHRIGMRVSTTLRSFEEQQRLFDSGRTVPGRILTNAKPGDSMHQFGLAADCCFHGDDPYLEKKENGEALWNDFGGFSKANGLAWGGDFKNFKDKPHVELTYGMSPWIVQNFYSIKGILGVWARCDKIRGVQEGSEWKFGPPSPDGVS